MNEALEPTSATVTAGKPLAARHRLGSAGRALVYRGLLYAGIPFFFVACTFTYYGQLNREQTGDVYGTIYTSVAIVQAHTIWLDRYKPYIEQHAGENPYMLTTGPHGHVVTATPTASSILALPVVALFTVFGAEPQDWHAWMQAAMLTAALTAAASVAVMFVLLTRLTTRRRAALIAATYAWATLEWGVSGQALWQHGGATLALSVALLALVDRKLVLAGAAAAAMVAFRPTTPIIVLFLLPLIGRRAADWARFLLGTAPFALPLLLYNWAAFGSPLHQGYGTAHATASLHPKLVTIVEGIAGLLVSPGRGLFVYSPVLLFAVVGAVLGRRTPLYRWCAVAAAAYLVVVANDTQWFGGQSFGARRLTEAVPLLTILLVPAIDAIVRTKWLRAYLVLLAWSVFVEMLAASAKPPFGGWFDTHDLSRFSVWWHPTDNELVAILQSSGSAVRLVEIAAVLAGGVACGFLATWTASTLRRPALSKQ